MIGFSFFAHGAIGVSKSNIEKDARQSQKINHDWLVTKDVTDEIAALLFYDAELEQHTFSVYLNREGVSYGCFFREGGSLGTIESAIQGFSYIDKGMALLSMNKKQVAEVKLYTGKQVETLDIDPLKPFVAIVPQGTDMVSLLDSNGEEVAINVISAYY